MSDTRLDKTGLTSVWNKMKSYVNSFMKTVDAKLTGYEITVDTKFNTLSVDYIVEEGTSGIWTYRKWNSGIAECWGRYTTTSSSLTHCGSTLPFTFSETPVVTANFGLSGQASASIKYVNASTTDVDMYGDNAGWNDGRPCWFFIHVYGRWK